MSSLDGPGGATFCGGCSSLEHPFLFSLSPPFTFYSCIFIVFSHIISWSTCCSESSHSNSASSGILNPLQNHQSRNQPKNHLPIMVLTSPSPRAITHTNTNHSSVPGHFASSASCRGRLLVAPWLISRSIMPRVSLRSVMPGGRLIWRLKS